MKLTYDKKSKELLPRNKIELSVADAARLDVEDFDRVLAQSGNKKCICTVRVEPSVAEGKFCTTKKVNKILFDDKGGQAEVVPLGCFCFDTVYRTAYKKGRQPLISVSAEVYKAMSAGKSKSFALVNKRNGEVFVFDLSEVLQDENLANTKIKASRLVRKFLLIDETHNGISTAAQCLKLYPAEAQKTSLCDRAKGFLRKLTNRICGFFAGRAEAQFKTFRPSDNDEDKNVVRLTKHAMTVLGISEGDNVYIKYKGKIKSVKAWEFDEKEKEREYLNGDTVGYQREKAYLTEHPNELVGIPGRIRNQMGINDIGINVKICRNCNFMFRKKILLSVLSIFALLISAEMLKIFGFFAALPLVWKIVCGVAAAVILLYIVMTEERGKVK